MFCYRYSKFIIILCFVIIFFFQTNTCFGDSMVLKVGEHLEGKIIDANKEQILFKANINNDIIVCSFDRQQITNIKLSPYEFPQESTIFDRIDFNNGDYWLGLIEQETPHSVTISLALDKGVGIVELPKLLLRGIDSTYGFRKMKARIFFLWRNFLCNMRAKIQEFQGKKVTLDNEIFKQVAQKIKTEKWDDKVREITAQAHRDKLSDKEIQEKIHKAKESLKIYTPDKFKKESKQHDEIAQNKLYESGVSNKSLMLGMRSVHVTKILGDPLKTMHMHGNDYLEYSNGAIVVLRKDRVVRYRNEIPNLEHILEKYYPLEI
jgi:hypothetical protein